MPNCHKCGEYIEFDIYVAPKLKPFTMFSAPFHKECFRKYLDEDAWIMDNKVFKDFCMKHNYFKLNSWQYYFFRLLMIPLYVILYYVMVYLRGILRNPYEWYYVSYVVIAMGVVLVLKEIPRIIQMFYFISDSL